MRISRFTVNRPIFTLMAVFIVLILGGISFVKLPIDLMPDITYPTLSISTSYTNASPEEMEELVTRPIEEAMSALPGVEELTSVSSEGQSSVRVTFAWGTDLDAASNDIRDRLDRVIPALPDDADRPVLRKFDLASFPILILGAYGNLDPIQMERLIQDRVMYRIESVPGVAVLDIWGELEREIHVNLDPGKIKALGLPVNGILARIQAENVNVPAGTIERGNLEVLVRTPGQYTDLDELRNTIIALRSGESIKLGEIASVEDTHQKIQRIVRINGQPGVRLSVQKQSGMNTVEVASRVMAEVRKINEELPQINLTPIIDTSDYIRRSISNVGSSALYGGLLAIFVLLLFLRNLRSTIIIATAIPISIIATFALMYFAGFTLNIMTLGGMALGIGMLVDSAIVVLENIYRMRESEGRDAKQAAVEGSEEVTAAIIASTLTTVVVFLPLVFMEGMSGVMFKQLAYVVSFSLLCSLVVSLTLVPMLASRLLRVTGMEKVPHESLIHLVYRVTGGLLIRIENAYKELLHVCLNHRPTVVVLGILAFIGCLLLVPYIGSEFMPAADEGSSRLGRDAGRHSPGTAGRNLPEDRGNRRARSSRGYQPGRRDRGLGLARRRKHGGYSNCPQTAGRANPLQRRGGRGAEKETGGDSGCRDSHSGGAGIVHHANGPVRLGPPAS
jgi:HAE1 family hydrophobic/amphiphilic exporter-1